MNTGDYPKLIWQHAKGFQCYETQRGDYVLTTAAGYRIACFNELGAAVRYAYAEFI